MLQRTAAAFPIVGRNRRHPIRARLQHLEQLAPIGLQAGPDKLARKGKRHEGRALRYAVTLPPDGFDAEV
jgi:hypothetical protein